MLTFFRVFAAKPVSIFPTFVEPVKLNFMTLGFVASSVAAARSFVGTTCKQPAGTPASKANFAKAMQLNGVSLGGLITTEHPAARAGATFLVIMAAGKFQGVIMPQTPTGSRYVMTLALGKEDGMVSP
jgi:hypothetical protein